LPKITELACHSAIFFFFFLVKVKFIRRGMGGEKRESEKHFLFPMQEIGAKILTVPFLCVPKGTGPDTELSFSIVRPHSCPTAAATGTVLFLPGLQVPTVLPPSFLYSPRHALLFSLSSLLHTPTM
jgi:hypothetical protein